MSAPQNRPVELGGHLGGVTALEYQHEDKFLAVARWARCCAAGGWEDGTGCVPLP